MKAQFTLVIFLLFWLTGLNAQTGFIDGSVVPLKPQSPLFGKDIVIHDQPDRNQRNLAVCSAFNGWLYAVYSYNNGIQPYVTFIRSTDNGISWNVIGDFVSVPQNNITTKLDIIACGNSLSTLKIFMAAATTDTTSWPIGEWGMESVVRYQGEPFVGEAFILSDGGNVANRNHYIALASDQNYSPTNANPFSIAVVYTKPGYGTKDTLKYCSSSNGGISFDNKRIVGLSNQSLEKVAISYGRSPSKPEGRYFVAWEKKNPNNASTGHIYTSHTEPNFDSPFTHPVCLDSLDPASINKFRNPVIACQVNDADNDSSNLTEVVLFDKYDLSNLKYDITGYYNLQATNHSNFKKLSISNSAHNNIQPSINFNPFDSTFMVTYYDSTTQKLPFFLNNFNLKNPDNWQIVTIGYNDDGNLSAPYPKVKVNFGQQDGINAWISEGTGGNGIAMFDASYSTYTGISGHGTGTSAKLIGSYPNPCSNTIKISFELKKTENVTIDMLGIMGQPLGTVTDQDYSAGKHIVKYDVSDLPNGNYLYNFRSGDFNATGKFTVIR